MKRLLSTLCFGSALFLASCASNPTAGCHAGASGCQCASGKLATADGKACGCKGAHKAGEKCGCEKGKCTCKHS